MIRRVFLTLVLGMAVGGCLDEWGIDDEPFPCRDEDDCVGGFICDPILFVCVGENSDVGFVDTSTDASDAGEDRG